MKIPTKTQEEEKYVGYGLIAWIYPKRKGDIW